MCSTNVQYLPRGEPVCSTYLCGVTVCSTFHRENKGAVPTYVEYLPWGEPVFSAYLCGMEYECEVPMWSTSVRYLSM
jgi:hypothetical protein